MKFLTFDITQWLAFLTILTALWRIAARVKQMSNDYSLMQKRVNIMWKYNLTRGMAEARAKHIVDLDDDEPKDANAD